MSSIGPRAHVWFSMEYGQVPIGTDTQCLPEDCVKTAIREAIEQADERSAEFWKYYGRMHGCFLMDAAHKAGTMRRKAIARLEGMGMTHEDAVKLVNSKPQGADFPKKQHRDDW